MKTSIVQNWKAAAEEFGCNFESPITIDHEGQRVEFFGRLTSADGQRCAIFHLIEAPDYGISERHKAIAERPGIFVSFIVRQRYEVYNKDFFGETLADWGLIKLDNS